MVTLRSSWKMAGNLSGEPGLKTDAISGNAELLGTTIDLWSIEVTGTSRIRMTTLSITGRWQESQRI